MSLLWPFRSMWMTSRLVTTSIVPCPSPIIRFSARLSHGERHRMKKSMQTAMSSRPVTSTVRGENLCTRKPQRNVERK